jgi:hypothetical protein
MRSAASVILLCVALNLFLRASDAHPNSRLSSVESGSVDAEGPLPVPASPIQDNSFLIEEAYNQEDGVIQHISFVTAILSAASGCTHKPMNGLSALSNTS